MADELVGQYNKMSEAPIPKDWNLRLARAEQLRSDGRECAVCGGTGGWPGLHQFVLCRPCRGSGVAI